MEYLDNIGEKVGLGNVDLDNIKKQASFYFRDKFKSARLLLTDVTPSQLQAEEATNDDEWGPATATMAAISDACRRPDESPRIMQVLHARLALIGKKHWRQFLKTLTVVEFLLFHGPEQVVMEFSSDRDLIEDLTRFNYVSERGVDHGMVVRKKATQVLKLLMEDDYLKEERARAQKLTKSIFGQGSYQSSSRASGASRYGGFGNNTSTSTSSASTSLMLDDDTDEYHHSDKKFTAFEERILSEKRGKPKSTNGGGSTGSEWRAFEDDNTGAFSPKQNATDSNWADFSNGSPERSPKRDGSSPFARSNDVLLEEDPFSPRSPQAPPPTSFNKPIVQTPLGATSKVPTVKEEPKKSKLKVRSFSFSTSTSGDNFKLPPPPPPPGGSKVTIIKSASAQPDLLDLSFDVTSDDSVSVDSHGKGSSLLNFETPPSSKVAGSDQAVTDLLGMTTSSTTTTSLPSEFDFLNSHVSGDKVSETRSPGLTQLVPDLFDLDSNSTTPNNPVNDLGSLGPHEATGFVKDQGGIPDFLNLNNNNELSTASEPDFFGNNPGVSATSVLPEDQNFGATGASPEVVVPDVFDAIAPDFASFGIHDTERKPVDAKPAEDDFFNLLS